MRDVDFPGNGLNNAISQSRLSLFGGVGINSGIFKLFFAGLVLFLGLVGSAGAVTPVTGCGTLSTAGETYVLQNDISATGTCITIDADNIILDGAGYSITGPGGWEGVYFSGRTGVTIKNLNVTNFTYGIYIYGSSNNTLIDNTANSNSNGITLRSSSNYNTLANNIANSNTYVGIYLHTSSNDNTIANNTASNNLRGIELHLSSRNTIADNTANSNGFYGITISSSSNDNTVANNIASNNDVGIYIGSSNNTVANNTVNSNSNVGIYTYSSANNSISNNHFNNTANYYFDGTIYSNDWNITQTSGPNIIDGPYLGGNFWAYPNGTGFSETCTDADSDGFCDSNYTLDSGNVDYLPLTMVNAECVTPPADLVSWWPGDGNADDIWDGNPGTLMNGATFAAGKVGQAFNLDGVGGHADAGNASNLNIGTGDFTVEFWVLVNDSQWNSILYKYSTGTSSWDKHYRIHAAQTWIEGDPMDPSDDEYVDSIVVTVGDGSGPWYINWQWAEITLGEWQHIAWVLDRDNGSYIYVNGVLESNLQITNSVDISNTGNLTIGTPSNSLNGLIDEVQVFNRSLTHAEILAEYNAGSAGKCKEVCVNAPSGMVSWWPGDGDATDIWDGNDGALVNGTTFAAGKVGQAFSFDGVDDQIHVPDSNSLDVTNITIDAWVKGDGIGFTNGDGIIWKYRTYLLQYWGGAINPGVYVNGQWCGTGWVPTATIWNNEWHHVALTYDGSEQRFYVDGTLKGSNTGCSGPIDITSNDLFIGTDTRVPKRLFHGFIDEVEIFDRALTESEIQAIYNAGSAGKCKPELQCADPPSGMISWWPLDETNGIVAYDIVDGNDGTHINGPTPVSGMVDGALSFDGVDDYVNLGNDSSLNIGTDDFSVDMWLYVNGISDADVIRKPSSGWITSNSKGYRVSTANGQIRVAVGNGGSWYINYQSANLSTNKWHHFAWVLDRDNGSYIYIDGVLSSTNTATDTTTDISSSNNASIGGMGQGFFNGTIDEVEIFDRALNASEVSAIYNAGSAGKCKPECVDAPYGLTNWWSGDGNAKDIQGGNDGTLMNGATFATGKVDQAFSFDGVDDFVNIGDDVLDNAQSQGTVDAWIKIPALLAPGTGTAQTIFSTASDTGSQNLWGVSIFALSPNETRIRVGYNSPSQNYVYGSTDLQPDQWYHVALTGNGTSWKLYVDGSEETLAAQIGSNTGRWWNVAVSGVMRYAIGVIRRSTGDGFYFNGTIDEVEIFDRALNASEVFAIYNAGSAGKCKVIKCGDTLNQSTTLPSDLVCNGTALFIGANDITLDCAGHILTGNGTGYGILAENKQNITIRDCVIQNFHHGIFFNSTDQSRLINNTARYMVGPVNSGFRLESSSSNILTSNIAHNNGAGVYFKLSSNNTLISNTAINSSSGVGIFLSDNSNNNTLTSNTANNNYYGIYPWWSSFNTITDNTANNNDRGIYLSYSSSNIITNNNAHNNTNAGIQLEYDSNFNTLSSNILTNNFEGIYLLQTPINNIISENIIVNNSYAGIYLFVSNSNTIINNTLLNNGLGNNTHGGIGLIGSLFNTLTNNTANNNYWGIRLTTSSFNTLANNTAMFNSVGIKLGNSPSNTLTNNALAVNGVNLDIDPSDNNTITDNTITNADTGIKITDADNNLVKSNKIINNVLGINLTNSTDNLIFDNLFNNTNNAIADGPNFWNTTLQLGTNIVGGPYLGGNFWAYPNGTGFSETCTDAESGGICESYTLASGNVDYLPLAVYTALPIINAVIDIDPDTLNLKSRRMGHHGRWITAYIELPEGYDVADINVSTVLLNDAISAELRPSNIGDYDRDDIPDLMVKFDRAEVIDLVKALNLDLPADVELTVSGLLIDGTQFEGTYTIRVIEKGRYMMRKMR